MDISLKVKDFRKETQSLEKTFGKKTILSVESGLYVSFWVLMMLGFEERLDPPRTCASLPVHAMDS